MTEHIIPSDPPSGLRSVHKEVVTVQCVIITTIQPYVLDKNVVSTLCFPLVVHKNVLITQLD